MTVDYLLDPVVAQVAPVQYESYVVRRCLVCLGSIADTDSIGDHADQPHGCNQGQTAPHEENPLSDLQYSFHFLCLPNVTLDPRRACEPSRSKSWFAVCLSLLFQYAENFYREIQQRST